MEEGVKGFGDFRKMEMANGKMTIWRAGIIYKFNDMYKYTEH